MNLTPEERQRRAGHIRPHGGAGRAKALFAVTREQRIANLRKATAKRMESQERLKVVNWAETVEGLRESRSRWVDKAAKLRDWLTKPDLPPDKRLDPAAAVFAL